MPDSLSLDVFFCLSTSFLCSLLFYSFGHFFLSLISFLVFGMFLRKLLNIPRKIQTPENFHVLIVGAGVSGICMGKKLTDIGVKYTILEKSPRLGGTWWENTYPGCGCDVPSHLYSFSFFLNPNWSRTYSKQGEILEYLKDAAERFGVYPHIQFGEQVSQCTWDKETNLWQVTTKEGKKLSANILISGSGALHAPHTPQFKGSGDFQGKTMHTARWEHDWDPKGQKVGIIGTGASAVQAIPELAKSDIEKLYVFQRTPCWSPRRGDIAYPDWAKLMFKHFPPIMVLLRTIYFLRGEFFFHAIIATDRFYNKFLSKIGHREISRQIKKVVKDPVIAAKLTPSYEMGCKRITPSDNYLPAFNKPCVELVTDPIQEFCKDGIKTSASSYTVDTIIYATGYDLLASGYAYQIINKHGVCSKEEYGNAPQGYLGICQPNYPNFFWLLGPGTGLGTNTVIYMIECQADYAVDCIKKMVADGARSVTVKAEVNEQFKAWSKETMKERVFGGRGSCNAWYKNVDGDNWTLWPSDLVTYWRMTRRCCWAEFDKTY
eukprot:GFUD01003125.1.p1 GENE.GFUD01003125.1~~GFUD01003125.1.p1  ORF type:complete len:546 (-),score=125.57 GFUD01003125.1:62-1699(-)